jgi:hypothetical protein
MPSFAWPSEIRTMRCTPPTTGERASSLAPRTRPHEMQVPPSSSIIAIAAIACDLFASVARSIGVTVSSPDEYVMIENASPASSFETRRAAAAFAFSIGSPSIEPERSITTASESAGRDCTRAAGAVIVTARFWSVAPRRIRVDVMRAVTSIPSSPVLAIGAFAAVNG